MTLKKKRRKSSVRKSKSRKTSPKSKRKLKKKSSSIRKKKSRLPKKNLTQILEAIRVRQEEHAAKAREKEEKRALKEAEQTEKIKKKASLDGLSKEMQEVLSQEIQLEAPMDRRRRKREPEEDENSEAVSSEDQTLDRTTMKIYLEQIEHIPLLTPEEEISLSKIISVEGPEAEQARAQMIRSNLRLVISIAKRYANMGLSFSDLVEEGNIGLMRAVEKFNPDRGYRFSTYASWWIKQALMRSLSNQGKTIRIPVYMYDVISKWRKVRDGLMQRLNRMPTRKEIADMMEIPVNKVKEIENIAGRPSSLNAPISLDGTAELIDVIEDDSSHAPDSQIGELLKVERIHRLLDRLDEREKKILILRFGLENLEPHTLEEVAQQFGITRERVRQIEVVAVKKVRELIVSENDHLQNYLG